MHRWIIGGLVGGAAGVAVWVGVSYATHYEVGWIAWGIGFAVGAGVRYGAFLGDEDESETQGIVAGAMAVGSIVVAKYILFCIFVGGVDPAALREAIGEIRFDEEALVASVADEVVSEKVENGQTIEWPEGMSFEEASREADYPPDIWQQAKERWAALGTNEQQERKRERIEGAAELSEAISSVPTFGDFFSPWDILWFGLAAVTAYKIGVGTYGTD